jgi:hypothetical protein
MRRAVGPNDPQWKTFDKVVFTRCLEKHYKNAFFEKYFYFPDQINMSYSIYPCTFYKRVASMPFEKTNDFCFIGQKNFIKEQIYSRQWLDPFIELHFGPQSYLQYNKEDDSYVSKGTFDYTNKVVGFVPRYTSRSICDQFDEHYFTTMKKSQFCLCPAGDAPWSQRFLEAIMCKCIPIVKESYETWRSAAEKGLDYKYYLADAPEFIYREDWVEHNYAIFLKYHTFEYR